MALIQCSNPDCELNKSSPQKPFEWNEFEQLEQGGEVVEQGTPNSTSLAIKCPTCKIRNIIWVTKLKKKDEVVRNRSFNTEDNGEEP